MKTAGHHKRKSNKILDNEKTFHIQELVEIILWKMAILPKLKYRFSATYQNSNAIFHRSRKKQSRNSDGTTKEQK